MSEIAQAFEQYLSSLSADEWDALTKRVRPVTAAMDAQIASDPHMIATLTAQIAALDNHIAELDPQIDRAMRDGNAPASIALKQEKQRTRVTLADLTKELERRQKIGRAQQ